MIDDTYSATYKCRSCGEEYSDLCAGKEIAKRALGVTLFGFAHTFAGAVPTLLDWHNCQNGDLGVCDFIGFKIKLGENE